MYRSCLLALFTVLSLGPANATSASTKPIRLPFRMHENDILISGRVDATPGVFMLDTGETYYRFLLNRDLVLLEPGTVLNRMHFASGQQLVTEGHKQHHRIVLAGVFTTSAQSGAAHHENDTVSENAAFMQKIVDPRFLGHIGWGFLKHYDFTIDYQKRIVSLYPHGNAPAHARGAIIKFTPASPIRPFLLTIGGISIPAVLDTGGWERLRAPEKVWRDLTAAGHVKPGRAGETGCVRILHARYGEEDFDIPHVEKSVAPKTMLTLGYSFLRHYLSVWEPEKGTVTLVPKQGLPRQPPSSCD